MVVTVSHLVFCAVIAKVHLSLLFRSIVKERVSIKMSRCDMLSGECPVDIDCELSLPHGRASGALRYTRSFCAGFVHFVGLDVSHVWGED